MTAFKGIRTSTNFITYEQCSFHGGKSTRKGSVLYMQRHESLAGYTFDTKMQGILGSLVQGRRIVWNLPAIQPHNWMVIA